MFKKIVFIGLVCLGFSCSKETDEQVPTIWVASPIDMQHIAVGDTVRVIAKITDNRVVESVSVTLVDDNGIPLLSTISEQPNVTEYDLDLFYAIDDIQISSGTYYFDVTAFDGVNRVYETVPVVINGIAQQREGIFIFDNVSNQTSIYRLDTVLNAILFKTLTGDFLGGAVNHYHQQVVCAGNVSGKVTVMDIKTGAELWSLPLANGGSFPSFTGVFSHNQTVYVAYYNENIRGYDGGGNLSYGTQAHSGYYGESGWVHEDVLLVEQTSKSIAGTKMVVYWMASGAERHQIVLSEDICGMFSLNNDEVILFTNDAANNGRLSFYSVSNNVRSIPFNIGPGKIDAVTQISTGEYLVARNGDLKIISANTFSTLPYLSGVNASILKYDVTSDELVVVDGNKLSLYDYTKRTVKQSYTHSNHILDMQFLYNK